MSIPYQKRPCAECPWRMDVPTGKFPPTRYRALAQTAYDLSSTVFACHMSQEQASVACAGYILQSSAHNLAMRMARQSFDDVQSPYPLYPTFRALAQANGVRASDPSLRNCRDDAQRRPSTKEK